MSSRDVCSRGWLRDAQLDASHGDFLGGGDHFQRQVLFVNPLGQFEQSEVDGGAGAGSYYVASFGCGGNLACHTLFGFSVGNFIRPLQVFYQLDFPFIVLAFLESPYIYNDWKGRFGSMKTGE